MLCYCLYFPEKGHTILTIMKTCIPQPFIVPMLWYYWRLLYCICFRGIKQQTSQQTNCVLLTLIALIMTHVSLFGYKLFSCVDNTVYQQNFKWKLQNIMIWEVCTKQSFWKFLVHVKILTMISSTVEFRVGLYRSKLNLIKTLQCIRLIPVLMELVVFGCFR